MYFYLFIAASLVRHEKMKDGSLLCVEEKCCAWPTLRESIMKVNDAVITQSEENKKGW